MSKKHAMLQMLDVPMWYAFAKTQKEGHIEADTRRIVGWTKKDDGPLCPIISDPTLTPLAMVDLHIPQKIGSAQAVGLSEKDAHDLAVERARKSTEAGRPAIGLEEHPSLHH